MLPQSQCLPFKERSLQLSIVMQKTILYIFLSLAVSEGFGQTIDAAAARRIGDYGKLWAVIDLFHPKMAYSGINRDSLFVDNIGGLLNNPSAAGFKDAVRKMLARLDDPYTSIRETTVQSDSVLLPKRDLLRWLPGGIAVVHFDGGFMRRSNNNNAVNPLSKLMDSLEAAQGLVIDLRNERQPDEMSAYDEAEFVKDLAGYLIPRAITLPGLRTRIHYGHESQTFDMSSFYFQGWVTTNGSRIEAKPKAFHKPVCLLVNRFNRNAGDIIAGLHDAGAASVVTDGVVKNVDPDSRYKMKLADSVTVTVRTGDAVYADGSNGFLPDAQVEHNGTDDTLIGTAVRFLQNKDNRKQGAVGQQTDLPASPFVAGYDSLSYPSAPLRLLGLMRYWTAINYFCPNKDRLTKNWDSVLYEYVPKFLSARDSFEYNRTAARLIKELNDGHGFFGSKVFRPLTAKVPPVQLACIEGKTIINEVLSDSLKKLLHPGDELLFVNGTAVKKLRDSLAQFIGASNNEALQRSVTNLLLAGKEGTAATIKTAHNGQPLELTLPRSANVWEVANKPRTGAVWKRLAPKLGYVDFGRLEVEQIDSMFTDLKNTDALILDNRSYPRGTVWTLINYLTDKPVRGAIGTTVIADSPDPNTATMQNTVWEIPVTPKWRYTGKLIVLVNETTLSQAEYSCMVLQAATKNVTIVGSQTAGADGDVTGISLPGGIKTLLSGHGIHYPDGRPTQGIGIVPDIKIKPTVAGIKAGRDEVLERAVLFAKTGK